MCKTSAIDPFGFSSGSLFYLVQNELVLCFSGICRERKTCLPAIAQRATAGVALGVDRMVLLFTGAKDINEVIFQSISDQVGL